MQRSINRIGSRSCALFCTVLVTAASTLLAPPAHAQFGGRASFGEAFQPDIMQRDVTLMTASLGIEEWQQPIVEALLQDYNTSFITGVEALKDRMKVASQDATKSSSTSGDAILEKVMQPLTSWRVEKRAMLAKFMADLKSTLGSTQLEKWPAFERALRRERMLPDGDLSGESVDLWMVLGRMQLTPAETEAVKVPVSDYEMTLDEALVARSSGVLRLEPELSETMRSMNFERGADIQDKIMVLRVGVRTANDQGIDVLAAALGERGAEFRKRSLESGYPDVFRPHPVMILMQQARALTTLTPDQISQIDALMSEFDTACMSANMKLYDAVRLEEPKAPRKRLQALGDRNKSGSAPSTPQGSNSNDPVVKARVEREKMGEPFRERLLAILSPEQRNELPGGVKVSSEDQVVKGAEPGIKGMKTGAIQAMDDDSTVATDRNVKRRNPRDAMTGTKKGDGGKQEQPVEPTKPE